MSYKESEAYGALAEEEEFKRLLIEPIREPLETLRLHYAATPAPIRSALLAVMMLVIAGDT